MFTKKIIQSCFRQAQLYQFAKQKTAGQTQYSFSQTKTFSLKKGQISQVIGAVVDVQFEG